MPINFPVCFSTSIELVRDMDLVRMAGGGIPQFFILEVNVNQDA